MTNFRILPSTAPVHSRYFPLHAQKQQSWSVARTFLLPTKQHLPRVGEGVTMVPNWQGGCPGSKKVQNS